MAGNRFRLRRIVVILAALLVAQGGVSLLLRLRSVHEALRARLERAFGRSVQVGRFGLSVWTGLRLEAHYVTVGEDPQFGYEFLLRADRVSASPDWRALMDGRLLFYRFNFDRPSLNVVRGPDGHWNFEAWARARQRSSLLASQVASSHTGRVDGIVVSNGRINFKRGADKFPFALVGVTGQISARPDGRWSITLEAQPLRAGVTLQDAGTLRLAGTLPAAAVVALPVGGATDTEATQVSLEWRKASLSDALRLIAGRDFGVRGSLDASLAAQSPRSAAGAPAELNEGRGLETSPPPGWQLSATLRLADVHRWDLPPQAGLPGLNLSVDAVASPDGREWDLPKIVLEARRSNLRGSAAFGLGESRHASARVVSASIHLDDLLAWYRAFHPGVRPGTWVDGYLGADVQIQGWPPRLVRATLATTGARLNLPGETGGIDLRRTVLEADANGASLAEAQVSLGGGEPGVRLAARANWAPGIPFEASLTGSTTHLAELSEAVAALAPAHAAQPLRAEGAAFARLAWKGSMRPWRVSTSGTMTLEEATLSRGPLRGEISVGNARLDFLQGQRRLQFSATKMFGGTWTGALRAPTLAGPWEFALSADRLNPAAIVRGFSAAAPENSSLLSRILPLQPATTPVEQPPPWPGWLRGEGTVAIGILDVGRLELRHLKGSVMIGQREVVLQEAEAAFFGGHVRGEARAGFQAQPRYAIRAQFDGAGVGPLAAVAVATRQCCTGTASGRVDLTAEGWDRDALLASLSGAGQAQVRSGTLLTLDLPATLNAAAFRPGHTAVRLASGDFVLASGRVRLERLTLDLPAESVVVQGSANYRGELDVDVANGRHTRPVAPSATAPRSVRLTGTLAAPQAAQERLQVP